MIKSKLFGRHYLITALILLAFVWVGSWVSRAVMSAFRDQNRPTMQQTLLDEDGQVIFPTGAAAMNWDWAQIEKPTEPLKSVETWPGPAPNETPRFKRPPPPGGRPGFGEGRPPGPPRILVLLPGQPTRYLLSEMRFEKRGPPPPLFLFSMGFTVLAVLLGAGVALILLFRNMGAKIQLADSVIEKLKKGDLRARFPVDRQDEIGQLMTRFNQMAEEIERLVEQLRGAEHARTMLMQELAHDLRTPVASLKNLLETMDLRKDSLTAEVRQEFMGLSLKEVDYFERLVEDLLLLAQVSEPRYQIEAVAVDLSQVLRDEVDSAASRNSAVRVESNIRESLPCPGDRHLLQRLFRNALENAVSFARSHVKVELVVLGEVARVVIQDDGPGLSPAALPLFGQRRISRTVGRDGHGRLSVGLGSVIMKRITDAHRGRLEARNQNGARIEIDLPLK